VASVLVFGDHGESTTLYSAVHYPIFCPLNSSTADWFSYLLASLCSHLPVEGLKPEFRRLFLQDLSWNAEVNIIIIFFSGRKIFNIS